MTRLRMFGEDKPFMAWARRHPKLPSTEWVQTDVDTVTHRYKSVVDNQGTRLIQFLMQLEVKSRYAGGPSVSMSQLDTLWKQHLVLSKGSPVDDPLTDYQIHHFGVSFVLMTGTAPDDSKFIWWGRFDQRGTLSYRAISADQLVDLMRFERDPVTLERNIRRRHHKTKVITVTERTPLGFEVEKILKMRS